MGADKNPDISPAMLEAGIEAYSLFDSRDSADWVVSAVYRAMEAARLKLGSAAVHEYDHDREAG